MKPNFSQKDTWVLRNGTLKRPKSAFCEFTKNSPFRLIGPLKSGMMPQGISGRKMIPDKEIEGKAVADKDLAKTIQVVFLSRESQVQILPGAMRSRSKIDRLFCLEIT